MWLDDCRDMLIDKKISMQNIIDMTYNYFRSYDAYTVYMIQVQTFTLIASSRLTKQNMQ